MEYPVPQFIESETKVIGPFTLKQFGFLATAFAIVLFGYLITKSLAITIFLGIFAGGGAVALVYIKVEGRPLPEVIISAFKFLFSPKKYLWEIKGEPTIEIKEKMVIQKIKEKTLPKKELRETKLHQTFWEIQTGQKAKV